MKCAKMYFYISILNWKLNGTFGARIKHLSFFKFDYWIEKWKMKEKFFWICFDWKLISKNKNQNFRIHFLIRNQKMNFKKFFHFSIFVLKLKNEKWKLFKIRFVFKSKNEWYFRYTDFLGISISTQNWKLKNDKKFSIFNF